MSLSKLVLLLAVCVSQAAALPANEIESRGCQVSSRSTAEFNPDAPVVPSTVEVIQYDGPVYNMTSEDWAAREHAEANNLPWDAPADMPRITLEPGQLLDFGGPTDLTKRNGNRFIAAFGGYGCDAGTYIVGVKNFGCGTGCISMSSLALSGVVQQQTHGHTYPTMDVWTGAGCNGAKLAHFGVDGTSSCSNVFNCHGFYSFVGYYNC